MLYQVIITAGLVGFVINLILKPQNITVNVILKNSFALGGISATILIRRNINDRR